MSMYYIGDFAFDGMYLEHHGILGQKWGVRRYQNKDGSLTREGYIHYYGNRSFGGRLTEGGRKEFLRNASKSYQKSGKSKQDADKLAEETYRRNQQGINEAEEKYDAKIKEFYDQHDGYVEKSVDNIMKYYEENEDNPDNIPDRDWVKWMVKYDDFGQNEDDPFYIYREETGDTSYDDAYDDMMKTINKYSAQSELLLNRYSDVVIDSDFNVKRRSDFEGEQGTKLAAYVRQNAKAKSKDDMISWKDFESLSKNLNIREDKLDEVFESLKSVYNYINKEGGHMSKIEMRNLNHSLKKAGINIPASYLVDMLYERD